MNSAWKARKSSSVSESARPCQCGAGSEDVTVPGLRVTHVLFDFFGTLVDHSPDVDQLVHTYLSEWNKRVRHLPGIGDLLTALAAEYRLAVVSNTQEADLVPGHLEAMGVRQLFDTVVTSFEVGWRKPHPSIYTTALNELGIAPAAAVFVGDTYEADYLGPLQAGIRSLLIDPHSQAAIPHEARLSSVFELPARLATLN